MRFNENALKHAAKAQNTDKEGRLQYKPPTQRQRENFQSRWFKLKGNLLFYFRTNEMGHQADMEPVGIIILERCQVQLNALCDHPFVFSIEFEGDPGRLHLFNCFNQQQCEDWVTYLTKASIEFMKAELLLLQNRIKLITGKDPIESYYYRHSIYKEHRIPRPVQKPKLHYSSTSVPKLRSNVPLRPAPPPPVRPAPQPPSQRVASSHFYTSAGPPMLGLEDLPLQAPVQLPVSLDPFQQKSFSEPPAERQATKPTMDGWEMFE